MTSSTTTATKLSTPKPHPSALDTAACQRVRSDRARYRSVATGRTAECKGGPRRGPRHELWMRAAPAQGALTAAAPVCSTTRPTPPRATTQQGRATNIVVAVVLGCRQPLVLFACIVSSCFGVILFSEFKQGCKEMVQVVRPGGRSAVAAGAEPHRAMMRPRMQLLQTHFPELMPLSRPSGAT